MLGSKDPELRGRDGRDTPGGTNHHTHQLLRDSPGKHGRTATGGALPPTVLYICYECMATPGRRRRQRPSEAGYGLDGSSCMVKMRPKLPLHGTARK